MKNSGHRRSWSRYAKPTVEEQNRPPEQGSDWTGRVGRTGQSDHSENGSPDSDTDISGKNCQAEVEEMVGSGAMDGGRL